MLAFKKTLEGGQRVDSGWWATTKILAVPRGRTAARAVAEHLQQAVVGLRLPTAQLVRVDPVAGGDRHVGWRHSPSTT